MQLIDKCRICVHTHRLQACPNFTQVSVLQISNGNQATLGVRLRLADQDYFRTKIVEINPFWVRSPQNPKPQINMPAWVLCIRV